MNQRPNRPHGVRHPLHHRGTRQNSQKQPQKSSGAIRKILLGVVLLWAIFHVVSRSKKSEEVATTQPQVSQEQHTTPPKKSSSQKKKKVKEKKIRQLSYSDILKLIHDKPPTLKQSQDTVTWEGVRLIRYFSLDTLSQQRGERLMRRYHPRYGGAVLMQPRTGRVLALVSYNNPEDPFVSDHLYGKALFPAASIAKVITSTAVLEKGRMTPSSTITITGRNHTLYKNQYAPSPKGPSRKISFSDAFAYSINPAFARLGLYHSGRTALYKSAQKLGFNGTVPFELPIEKSHYRVPTDTSGIADVSAGFNQETTLSPMLGALIAGAISNGGKMVRPTLVDSVVTLTKGVTVYTRTPQLWRIATTPKVADQLAFMMHEVTRKGSARKSFKRVKDTKRFNSYLYGGKTGSVDKDGFGKVNWFIGFLKDSTDANKHLSVGVFTTHGPNWTVHSAFVAGEMLRLAISDEEKRQKRIAKEKEAQAEALKNRAIQKQQSEQKEKEH